MRLLRKLTNKEWKEIGEKYKDGGVHMFRGKKTLFYNGEKLYNFVTGEYLIHDEEERESWEVIIVLPGVKVIPEYAFRWCANVKTVVMSDSVKRIEEDAFSECHSLKFVKLSRNLRYIGGGAFYNCESLTSIFIPPSCRQIGMWAFGGCKELIILGMHQHTQLDLSVFQSTGLINKSPIAPIETDADEDGYYDSNNENEVVRWVKSINDGEAYALHRACASFNPLPEIIHDLVKRHGIKAMKMKNAIGISPSQYLEANTFADISEKEIINRYILDSMGEVF